MASFFVSPADVGRSALAIPGRSVHAGPPGHNGVESKALAPFARDVLDDSGFGQHVGKQVMYMPPHVMHLAMDLVLVVFISLRHQSRLDNMKVLLTVVPSLCLPYSDKVFNKLAELARRVSCSTMIPLNPESPHLCTFMLERLAMEISSVDCA